MVRRSSPALVVMLATLSLSAGACGGTAAPPPTSTPTETPTPPGASPPPGEPVPDVLRGRWAQIASPNDAQITLSGNKYVLTQTGNTASGGVVVNADEIDFFNGTICGLKLPEGIGRYRWSLSAAGILHFTPLNADECGRAQNLADADYQKA